MKNKRSNSHFGLNNKYEHKIFVSSKRSNSRFDFAICNNNLSKSKRSQAWGIDLIVAMLIFSIGIVAFYMYALNEPSEAKETIESLFYDGGIIASSILSEGYPENWDSGNAVTIGILSENKINETKIERFYNIANTNYAQTKHLFNTKYDYYFFLNKTITISSAEVEGIGKAPTSPKNLIKITRFTIYKNEPITAYLYVFD